MVRTTSTDDEAERRRQFGQALREALAVRKKTQRDLGALLGGLSQPWISAWIAGDAEPVPLTVFEVERVLELVPGSLSKLLGYLPLDAVTVTADFDKVVKADPYLDDDAKKGLVSMYRSLRRG